MWFPPNARGVIVTDTPWGGSNRTRLEGGFQKLGRLSRPSTHHLLTLARIRSRGDIRGRSRADGF
eukprot:7379110-Prymnesium_polylepis.1